MTEVAGVDGCGGGWFAVELEDENFELYLFSDIFSLYDNLKNLDLILIDIPIGIPEEGIRKCDFEARRILGRYRASTVFTVPCRKALYADGYKDACMVNEKITGKKISKQLWNIVPKIREVNSLLERNPDAVKFFIETHPEVCIMSLNTEPIRFSKKNENGFNERKNVLKGLYPFTDEIIEKALSTFSRSILLKDDILDALVCAVTAKSGRENLISIPEYTEIDSKGIPMQIVYKKVH